MKKLTPEKQIKLLRQLEIVREDAEAPFQSIWLALSAIQWGHLCMREGESYIGGCCGNTSHTQDKLNGFFRDTGYIDSGDLLDLVDDCIVHDGDYSYFHNKWWGDLKKKDFDAYIKDFQKIDPWIALAMLWHLIKDHLKEPSKHSIKNKTKPRTNRRDPSFIDQACHVVERGLWSISISHMFKDDREKKDDVQKIANRQKLLHQLWPAIKTLHDNIQLLSLGPADNVFCIFDTAAEYPASNGHGLCIYETQDEAEKMIVQWMEDEDEETKKEFEGRFVVRPCSVSMDKGIVYGD
jgi:hypothetical protein